MKFYKLPVLMNKKLKVKQPRALISKAFQDSQATLQKMKLI